MDLYTVFLNGLLLVSLSALLPPGCSPLLLMMMTVMPEILSQLELQISMKIIHY